MVENYECGRSIEEAPFQSERIGGAEVGGLLFIQLGAKK
jgi:hypothetical protein